MFIYDLTLFTFFELYHASIPMFVPDRLLATRYLFRGAVSAPRSKEAASNKPLVRSGWPEKWNDLIDRLGISSLRKLVTAGDEDMHPIRAHAEVPARFIWAHLVECYWFPEVQTFKSLPDWIVGLRSANFQVIPAGMRRFDTKGLQKVSRYWRAALPRLLSFR